MKKPISYVIINFTLFLLMICYKYKYNMLFYINMVWKWSYFSNDIDHIIFKNI